MMMDSDKNKILCFGELLLHFAPDTEGNWLEDQNMKTFVGGAEYNVASALARWGNPVKMLTALPDNYIGKHLINRLECQGIEVLADKNSGRIGTFYLPSDGDMQHAGVVYDRSPSIFTESDFSAFSTDEVFAEVGWLHITTITPALSDVAFEKCLSLMREAKQRKVMVSLDLNYREKLWAVKNPTVIKELMPYVNVLMGNIWAAESFLSITVDHELNGEPSDENLLKQAEKSARKIKESYPNVELIANTFRFTYKNEVDYFATLFNEDQLHVSERYHAGKVEERVGSGDAFMAALIHGKIKENNPKQILEDATKVAFRKLFVKGDTIGETINIENL